MKMIFERLVHVRAYVRLRFAKVENVRTHTRSWPKQLAFNF